MQINSVNNSPNFQARLITTDNRLHNYVKMAYQTNGKKTFDILDEFLSVHPDDVAIAKITSYNNKTYFSIKNGATGYTKEKEIKTSDKITPEDSISYIDFLKEIMDNKKFWKIKKKKKTKKANNLNIKKEG